MLDQIESALWTMPPPSSSELRSPGPVCWADHNGEPVPVPPQAFTLAVTPNGKTLYVTAGPNLLIPIRTSTSLPGTPIVVGTSPSAIAFAMVG